jgi:hypothetical protein
MVNALALPRCLEKLPANDDEARKIAGPARLHFRDLLLMRGLEQVPTDICSHNLDEEIIGTYAGLPSGRRALPNHRSEDIPIIRSMANLAVVLGGDGDYPSPMRTSLSSA